MIEFAIGLTVVLVLGVIIGCISLNDELAGMVVILLIASFYVFGIYLLGSVIKQLFL